jgi:GABA permease
MHRCLVVANQTLPSRRLLRELKRRVDAEPCEFHLLVPAEDPNFHAFWTAGEADAIAQERLDTALARLRLEGIAATGTVGGTDPVDGVAKVLADDEFDEIIVSTLPPGLSSWMHRDLPGRIERRVGVAVRHVITPFSDLGTDGGRLEELAL